MQELILRFMKVQTSSSRKTFKPTDIIIVVITASVLALTFVFRGVSSKSGSDSSSAAIFHNGEQIALLPLEKDGVYPFDEYFVTVEVKDGRVRISDSGCPDKICEKTGFISSPFQTIVCLPNRISVRIIEKNPNTDSNIDVVLN